VHFRLQKLAPQLRTDPGSGDRPNAAAELIPRKLKQPSVLVESTLMREETTGPVDAPSPALS
jgi:hypothetical protein